MQTVYRQDGTAVELVESEAQQWIKRGLATAADPKAAQPAVKQSWRSKVADVPVITPQPLGE